MDLRDPPWRFALVGESQSGVVLGLDDNSLAEGIAVFEKDRTVNTQRWLLEEDRDSDVPEL